MKANDFVKEYGFEKAKKLINEAPKDADCFMFGQVFGYAKTITDKGLRDDEVRLYDLKRLVESHEIVEGFGGLDAAKKELSRQSVLRWVNPETERLRSAIADVESCQMEGE